MKRKTIGSTYMSSFACSPPCCAPPAGCVNLLESSWLPTMRRGRPRSAVHPRRGMVKGKAPDSLGNGEIGNPAGDEKRSAQLEVAVQQVVECKENGDTEECGRLLFFS